MLSSSRLPLLSRFFSPSVCSSNSASGRWYPQPDCPRLFSTSPGDSVVSTTSAPSPPQAALPQTEQNSSVVLDRERAAPIYAPPRGQKKFCLVRGAKGELLADYVLFEEAIQRIKVPRTKYSDLTREERDIYMAHFRSVEERRLFYLDPQTKLKVFNISHHIEKGKCCGCGCRHCPYEHENAEEDVKRSKRWNGAFFV